MSGKHATRHTNDDNSNAGGSSYEEWRQDRIASATEVVEPSADKPARDNK